MSFLLPALNWQSGSVANANTVARFLELRQPGRRMDVDFADLWSGG